VVALPTPHFAPDGEALRLAGRVIRSLDDLTPRAFEEARAARSRSGEQG
jgi:hypothetical protein